MRNFTISLLMLLSTLGPSAVIAVVGFGCVRAIARNPAASAKVLLVMITSFIFSELIAVLGLLLVYILFK